MSEKEKYCTICTSRTHTKSHHKINPHLCEHCARFVPRLYDFEDTQCCRNCRKIFREEKSWPQSNVAEIARIMPWNSNSKDQS